MDQLNAMRTFVRVIQTGSFSAAGREQSVSQASISKKVAALEKQLGVKLLSRTSREQALTQAGAEYYEHCLVMLAELDEVEAKVRSKVSSPSGVLRIASSVSLGKLILAPLIVEFLQEYPDIEIDMLLEERHIDLIVEGVDIAIRARKLEDSSLIALPLFDNPLILVAAPEYLALQGEPQVPEDLKQHNCITFTLRKTLNNWHFHYAGKDIAIPVSGSFRSNSGDTNLTLALAGAGITQVPIWMVEKHLKTGRLIKILPKYTSDSIPLNMIYPQSRYVPLKVRCFIDFVKARLGASVIG